MGRTANLLIQTLAYLVLLELGLVAAVLYWPNFEENIGAIRSLAGPIPMLQDLADQIEATGVFGYIAGQHFFKGCNTLGTAAAILFAVGAIAGEAHRGTLEILLARPYSRLRTLSERYLTGWLALTLPIFASSLSIPWLAEQVDELVDLKPFLLCAVHASVFLTAIYSIAFFLSSVGSHPTRIALACLFGSTFAFSMYMVKVVTRYSPFRLCDIEDFVRIEGSGTLDYATLAPLALVSVLLFALSAFAFSRRVP